MNKDKSNIIEKTSENSSQNRSINEFKSATGKTTPTLQKPWLEKTRSKTNAGSR